MSDSAPQDDPRSPESAPSFEEALVDIQAIVEELEAGSVGLEESMQRFERGTTLLKNCYDLLKDAERRIEILTTRGEDGELQSEPFDASATHEQKTPKAGRRKKKTTRKTKPPADETTVEDDTLF